MIIEKLRSEARQAALDYFADVILYNNAKPKIETHQAAVKSATDNIERANQTIATLNQNLAANGENLAALRDALASNNEPRKAPAIEANIAANVAKANEMQTTLANTKRMLSTYQKTLETNKAAIRELQTIGKPKKPAGLYGLEL